MKHVVDVDWDSTTDIAPDVKMTFKRRVIFFIMVHLNIADGKHNIVFSGDHTRSHGCLMLPTPGSLGLKPWSLNQPMVLQDYQPSRQEANQELQDIVSRTLMGGKMIVLCLRWAAAKK